jgi:hypothetical protein
MVRGGMKFTRVHAYGSRDTHQCKPIGDLLRRYASDAKVIIDPFARNCTIGTITNDINPETSAQYHMDAREFMQMLIDNGTQADLIILDPPYSPRQISDLYKSLGLPVTMQTTQNAPLYAKVKKLSNELLCPGGHVVTLGWNSMGMGKSNSYDVTEIVLVCHGGAQNDTICVVEQKESRQEVMPL